MLTAEHAKENLCRAYVIAIASAARQNLSLGDGQDYGVDGTFKKVEARGSRLRNVGVALDFQAKSTVNWQLIGSEIVYDLEAKNYNDLVERAQKPHTTPFVLILLCLPRQESEWTDFDSDRLIVRKCVYYVLLSGTPLDRESGTKRIRVPAANVLTPDSLNLLLEAVKAGTILP